MPNDNSQIIDTTSAMPPVSPKTNNINPKKKWIVVLGIIFIIFGIAASVFLIQRRQELREKAASGSECQHSKSCILLDEPGNSGSFSAPQIISHVFITAKDYHRFDPPGKNDGCYDVKISGRELGWNRVGDGPDCKDVSNVQIWLGEPPPTVTLAPTNPQIAAACSGVKAYNLNWQELTNSQLSSLKEGDAVRFAVSGSATSGIFEKARFSVNGNSLGETINKQNGSNVFYIDYVI